MLQVFVLLFRETLEIAMALIVILTYTHKLSLRRYTQVTWAGFGGGVVLSVLLALIVHLTIGAMSERSGDIMEMVILFIAGILVASMALWAAYEAPFVQRNIEKSIPTKITSRGMVAVFFLSLLIVFREGTEIVFLLAALAETTPAAMIWTGGLLGTGLTIVLSFLIVLGFGRVNIKFFFSFFGFFLILFCAGFIAHGVAKVQVLAGSSASALWNLSGVVPKKSVLGSILGALFSYDPSPTALQVISYVIILAALLTAFWLLSKASSRRAAQLR